MARAFAWIVAAYTAALVVAILTVQALANDALWAALWADLLATAAVFAFSLSFRNSSFYDAYWSVAPPLLLGYWWWTLGAGFDWRLLLAALLVLTWAIRLTWNWASGWQGLGHADWRYVRLKDQLGRGYWPVSFLGVHLVPTLVVFAGCLPLYVAAGRSAPLGLWDGLGVIVGSAAVWLETRADLELRVFRMARASRSVVLDTGVWSWCRHPNYLGEIGFWAALACFGLGAAQAVYWSLMGLVAILALFLGVSIPMLERKLVEDKPDFAAYRCRTPMLLPWGSSS